MNYRSNWAIPLIGAGLLLILLSFPNVYADDVVEGRAQIFYTSAPNPVGSGARAMGMGGTFISIADDATAASWNPAGLVQLKRPEFSIVGSFVTRSETLRSHKEDTTLEGGTVDMTNLNYLSVVYPFSWLNRNMAVSLNYQRLYDYSSKGKSSDNDGFTKRKMSGSLSPLGLVYSLQILPKFKWGVTFNFWDQFLDQNKLKESYQLKGMLAGWGEITYKFEGFNFNTGVLFNPSEKIGVGMVFKSPFSADIAKSGKTVVSFMGTPPEETTTEAEKKLFMPLSFGIGGYYKVSDVFKISMDIYQTDWNHYYQTDGEGKKYSAITGIAKKDSKVDPTRQVRAGMEYLFVQPEANQTYPLRMGVFYDPIPDKGSPVDAYGASVGTGLSTVNFAIDCFYQYKFSTGHPSKSDFEEYFPDAVKEHQVYLSFIYYL